MTVQYRILPRSRGAEVGHLVDIYQRRLVAAGIEHDFSEDDDGFILDVDVEPPRFGPLLIVAD